MKLFRLNEAEEESWEDLLAGDDDEDQYVGSEKEPEDESEPCPRCGGDLSFRIRMNWGKKEHILTCQDCGKSWTVKAPFTPEPEDVGPKHTCGGGRKKDEKWSEYVDRINACEACKAEREELEVDDDDNDDDDTPILFNPGEISTSEKLSDKEKEAEWQEGDPLAIRLIKALRGMGNKPWTRRGAWHERFGKRIREKDKCTFGHTCQDPEKPLPVYRGGKGKGEIFDPVTGAVMPEYMEYYKSKRNCPVCGGDQEPCPNRVSTKYGAPKPFCKEHIGESPYIKNLMGKEMPADFHKEARLKQAEWSGIQANYIKVGDKVDGGKKLGTGKVTEIDDSMGDRTHRVVWDNPKNRGLAVTWEDPIHLDVIE